MQFKSMITALVMKIHVAVARATVMSGAEMRTIIENQAEQIWTFHHVTLLNEMHSVDGDALENQTTSLLNEATAKFRRHQRQGHEHLQDYQQGGRRHWSEVQKKTSPSG